MSETTVRVRRLDDTVEYYRVDGPAQVILLPYVAPATPSHGSTEVTTVCIYVGDDLDREHGWVRLFRETVLVRAR